MTWINTGDFLPACNKLKDSFGVEVLIWPRHQEVGATCFFGCRITAEPEFYKYGAVITGDITHWMPLPEGPPPSEKKG